MQSPKFPLKRKDIQKVINVARLKSRWKVKVRDSMRRKSIPDPIENLDFHKNLDAACLSIETEVITGIYIPQPPARFLSEKSKGLCRQLVIPAVRDALILQTLSDDLWVELRTKSPSQNSFYAPEDHGFSKAIAAEDDGYGSFAMWLNFQETILGFTNTHKFIVVTDIANYYDCISYEHLRNILADTGSPREHILDILIYTLSHLLWQPDYMPKVAVGLPQMNLDAPRLLAHCFLFEIDRLLEEQFGVDFARFMDDIDIGVDSIAEAKTVLRDLDLSLQTRQVRLNSGKTNILTATEAKKHFRIRENAFLGRLENSIKGKIVTGSSLARERNFISKAIKIGLYKGLFNGGNGSKILKRLIGCARIYGAYIDNVSFESILLHWPQLRQTILQWWQNYSSEALKLQIIVDVMSNSVIVDDASLIDTAVALVNARLPASLATQLRIEQFYSQIHENRPWHLYAKIWILSKYGSPQALFKCIDSNFSIWASHEYLTRLVSGMHPILQNHPLFATYNGMLRKAGDRWSATVLNFHHELSTTIIGYTSISPFLLSPNPAFPNRITHAKFLMICSALNNPMIAPTAVTILKSKHVFALQDPYYKIILN